MKKSRLFRIRSHSSSTPRCDGLDANFDFDVTLSNLAPIDAILIFSWMLQNNLIYKSGKRPNIQILDISETTRNSHRPFELNTHLISLFFKEQKISVLKTKLSHNCAYNLRDFGEGLITDFSVMHALNSKRSKSRNSSITIAIATSMADILVASKPTIKYLFNPWKLEARIKWGKFLKSLENDYWIMPRLSFATLRIQGKLVLPVESENFEQSCSMFFQVYCKHFSLGRKIKEISEQKIAVIDFGVNPSEKFIKSVKKQVEKVLGSNFTYIVKQHPAQLLGFYHTSLIHRIFGYENCKLTLDFDNDELRALPLEVLFFALPNSIYFGTLTGGVHVLPLKRIHLLYRPFSKQGFLLHQQYAPFLSFLKAHNKSVSTMESLPK